MDHIDAMDQLRQGIGLRAMGSQDPVVQYRNEGVDMFDAMNAEIRNDTVRALYRVEIVKAPEKREQVAKANPTAGDSKPQPKRVGTKIGPNDPCPCGSGKKYKKCCGRTAE